ncbi:MAG: hypothetical protein V1774_03980, partial [Candidatus Eisenbacteria bacterium]
VFWLARRMKVARHPLVGLVALLGVFMSESAAYIKPEIFSYVLTVAAAMVWFRIKTGGENAWRTCYLFPVIMLLWVNTHGGFIFGLLFLGLMFAGETLNRASASPQALPPRVWRHLAYAMALSGLALLINPHGLKYPLHLATALPTRSDEGRRMVRAYLSIFDPRVRHLYYANYLAIAALVLLALLWRRMRPRRIDWALLLTNVGLAFVYTRYLRSTYYWVPVFAFSSVYLLRHREGLLWPQRPRGTRTVAAVIALAALLLTGQVVYRSVCRPSGSRWFGFGICYQNPVAEAEYIREHFSGLRLGNDYGGGGYLLWRLHPQTKVMLDPRAFPYRNWLHKYQSFATGRAVPQFVEEFASDVWCINLQYESATTWFLHDPRWTVAFYGPSSAVFVREGVPFPQVNDRSAESIARISSASQALYVFRFAMALSDWDTASQLLTRMREHFPCPDHRKQQQAMADLYVGARAFYDRDYPTAVRHLTSCRTSGIIRDDFLLGRAYHQLTATAWKRGEDQEGYRSAAAALALDGKDLAALYNTAVIEWYLEARREAGQSEAQRQSTRGLLVGQAPPQWGDRLRLFLSETGQQAGINPRPRRIAAQILQGDYAERPDLVLPGPGPDGSSSTKQ